MIGQTISHYRIVCFSWYSQARPHRFHPKPRR